MPKNDNKTESKVIENKTMENKFTKEQLVNSQKFRQ